MTIEEFKELTQSFAPAIHGAIGGAIRFVTGDEKSFWRGVVTMVVGAVCAQYLTPLFEDLIHKYFGVQDTGYALSFIIGYLGLIILKKAESLIKSSTLGSLFRSRKV